MSTLWLPGQDPQDPPWGEPGTPSALSLPQGGQIISDITTDVNEGSQEKLFITEATARYGSWDGLPLAWLPNFSMKIPCPRDSSMETGVRYEYLGPNSSL